MNFLSSALASSYPRFPSSQLLSIPLLCVECVRNLATWFDNHMSMDIHVVKVCSEAFRGLYTIT